jgi:hypothetical protein
LPHPILGRLHEPLAMTGTSALRENGDAIDDGAPYRDAFAPRSGSAYEDIAGDYFHVPHDPAGETGHQPIARIVVGVIDRRMELSPRRRGWQTRQQLQNFTLIAGPSRSHVAFREHPCGGGSGHRRVERHMPYRRPLGGYERATADNRASGTNVDGVDALSFQGRAFGEPNKLLGGAVQGLAAHGGRRGGTRCAGTDLQLWLRLWPLDSRRLGSGMRALAPLHGASFPWGNRISPLRDKIGRFSAGFQ